MHSLLTSETAFCSVVTGVFRARASVAVPSVLTQPQTPRSRIFRKLPAVSSETFPGTYTWDSQTDVLWKCHGKEGGPGRKGRAVLFSCRGFLSCVLWLMQPLENKDIPASWVVLEMWLRKIHF